jgi:hydrocephalus-inducing protein
MKTLCSSRESSYSSFVVGIEVNLDTDSLPFGIVVESSQKTKKVVLENTGDIPITFNWDEGTLGPHFVINPMQGKLASGNEVSLRLTIM